MDTNWASDILTPRSDAGDGPGTYLDAEGGQFGSDLLGGAARPADTGDGIAGDIVLERSLDRGDHLGRFCRRTAVTWAAHAVTWYVPGEQLTGALRPRYRGRYQGECHGCRLNESLGDLRTALLSLRHPRYQLEGSAVIVARQFL